MGTFVCEKNFLRDLAQRAPTSAYNIYKEVRTQKTLRHTRYSVVNRRVRTLEELGYIKRIGTKETKAGFTAPLYQLTQKAYLAIILNQISLEAFIKAADEVEILTALGIFRRFCRIAYMSVRLVKIARKKGKFTASLCVSLLLNS